MDSGAPRAEAAGASRPPVATAAIAPDGTLAAYTDGTVEAARLLGERRHHLALPEHRGHSLGLAVKLPTTGR